MVQTRGSRIFGFLLLYGIWIFLYLISLFFFSMGFAFFLFSFPSLLAICGLECVQYKLWGLLLYEFTSSCYYPPPTTYCSIEFFNSFQIRNSKNVKAAVSDVIYLACYIRAISSLRLTAIGRIVSHFSGVKGLSPPGHCSGEPSATTQTVPFEISLNPCIYLCI